MTVEEKQIPLTGTEKCLWAGTISKNITSST